MRIYLVQHGEAHSEETDQQRHLTARGAEQVTKVAAMLAGHMQVEQLWHSDKLRAQQTAELLAARLNPRAGTGRRDGLGPKDPVAPVAKAIEHLRTDLMLIGHQPFLGKLAGLLMTGREESGSALRFQYGSVVCLERSESNLWQLAWMLTPELAV